MPHADAGHAGPRDYLYLRHTLPVRLMHWTNVVALTILLMSGLQIFNAHPRLYWAGKSSYTGAPPVLEIGARQGDEAGWVGTTRVFGHEFVTTGVLGVSKNADGQPAARGVSVVDHDSGQPVAVDGAGLALLLRVGAAHQRPRLRRLFDGKPASRARPRAGSQRLALDRRVDPGSPALPPSDGRGGQALQRAAEARVSRRDLRPAAAHHPDGARDVAVDEFASCPAGWISSAAGRRRGRSISSPPGCSSRSC